MQPSLSALPAAFKGQPARIVRTSPAINPATRVYSAAYGETCRRLFAAGIYLAELDQWALAERVAEMAAEVSEVVANAPHGVVGQAVTDATRGFITLIHEAKVAGGDW